MNGENSKGSRIMEALIQKRVTKMFDEILKFVEVACLTDRAYSLLRGRILDIGNQTIRDLQSDCKHFDMILRNVEEDVVELEREG